MSILKYISMFGPISDEVKQNTPRRIKEYIKELNKRRAFNFTTFDSKGYNELVIMKDIEYYSQCEHHFLPFYGKCDIGYLPGEKICGLSKLARLTVAHASYPTTQEYLTQNIADDLYEKLAPRWLIIVMKGKHLCMMMRGAQQQEAITITSAIRHNDFKDKESLKKEFFELCKGEAR